MGDVFVLGGALSTETKLNYARNPFTPQPILELLASDESWTVRKKVAGNPNLPPSAVALLMDDPFPEVRAELALNSYIPAAFYRKLAEDRNHLVRVALAQNPSVPLDVLRRLAKDPNTTVREALAFRRPIEPEVAQILKDDPSATVRVRLLSNPTVPSSIVTEAIIGLPPLVAIETIELLKPLSVEVQRGLSQRASPMVKVHLALAPWVDQEVWKTLRGDPDPTVRAQAERNPIYAPQGEESQGA